MVVHCDSTSAIARVRHPGAGPAQRPAENIFRIVGDLATSQGKSAGLHWVKGHSRVPGNERAGALAGEAAEKNTVGPSHITCLSQAPNIREVPEGKGQVAHWSNAPRY